jgi:hypothetical protein
MRALALASCALAVGCGAQMPAPALGPAIDSTGALSMIAPMAAAWQTDAKLITLQSSSSDDVRADGTDGKWTATYFSKKAGSPNVTLWTADAQSGAATVLTMRTFGEDCYLGIGAGLESSSALLATVEKCWRALPVAPDDGSVARSLSLSETCADLYGSQVDVQLWVVKYQWTERGAARTADLRLTPDGVFQSGEGPCPASDTACLSRTPISCN